MKNLHPLLFLLMVAGHMSLAQTYSSGNYASVGDTVYLTKAQSSFMKFDTTGTAIIWDYATLTGISQEQLVFRNPNQTGFSILQWPYIFNSNNTNLSSTTGQSRTLSALGITQSNPNDFFKKGSADLKQVASSYQLSYNSLTVSVKNQFSSADVVYKFPVSLGNSDSSTSGYVTEIPATYYEKQSQKRKNVVDGTGTVITPYGTFSQALRIVSTLETYDSIVVLGTSLPVIRRTYRELKWLDASRKYPVLTVIQNKVENAWVTSSVAYLDDEHFYPVTALFAYTPLAPIQGDSVAFQNLSSNASRYYWNFGDGASGSANESTVAHPAHIYSNPGTYNVELIASNDQFADTVRLPIVVYSNLVPTASFSSSVAASDTCLKFNFTNTSQSALSYTWNFGDTLSLINSSVATNPSHRFSGFGTYSVRLIASNGSLKDTIIKDVTVQGTLVPQITISTPTTTISPGTSVTFSSVSANGGNTPTYQWKKNNANVGSGEASYTDAALANGDKITCLLTSNASCRTADSVLSNELVMSVSGETPTSITKPVITPATGTYPDPLQVTITCATPGVTIYYSTSGNVPVPGTTYTRIYSVPFSLISSVTVRAMATLSGLPNSDVAVSYITITNPGIVAAPAITPLSGLYSGQQTVSISCPTSGSAIYFTLNGNSPNLSTPNSYTKMYSGPFNVNASTTVKAIGVKTGLENSPISVQNLTITSPSPTVATPVITPGTGNFNGSQLVSISCATAGATIYVTTSGNVPVPGTSYTKEYNGSFTISATTTIRAMAVLAGSVNSGVAVSFLTKIPGREGVTLENEQINPLENAWIHVFPNPTSGIFSISVTDAEVGEDEIAVLDMHGRTVTEAKLHSVSGSEKQIDLSTGESGLYLIRLCRQGVVRTVKVVKL